MRTQMEERWLPPQLARFIDRQVPPRQAVLDAIARIKADREARVDPDPKLNPDQPQATYADRQRPAEDCTEAEKGGNAKRRAGPSDPPQGTRADRQRPAEHSEAREPPPEVPPRRKRKSSRVVRRPSEGAPPPAQPTRRPSRPRAASAARRRPASAAPRAAPADAKAAPENASPRQRRRRSSPARNSPTRRPLSPGGGSGWVGAVGARREKIERRGRSVPGQAPPRRCVYEAPDPRPAVDEASSRALSAARRVRARGGSALQLAAVEVVEVEQAVEGGGDTCALRLASAELQRAVDRGRGHALSGKRDVNAWELLQQLDGPPRAPPKAFEVPRAMADLEAVLGTPIALRTVVMVDLLRAHGMLLSSSTLPTLMGAAALIVSGAHSSSDAAFQSAVVDGVRKCVGVKSTDILSAVDSVSSLVGLVDTECLDAHMKWLLRPEIDWGGRKLERRDTGRQQLGLMTEADGRDRIHQWILETILPPAIADFASESSEF
eukprot:Hpha_TRINITY_DN35689_c0_g1::TRINITY_DN35689_c0_g1_i1::g.68548::m.68548